MGTIMPQLILKKNWLSRDVSMSENHHAPVDPEVELAF